MLTETMADNDTKPEGEQQVEEMENTSEVQGRLSFVFREKEDPASNVAAVASQLMRNPGVLAALQDKLGSMVGTPSGYIQSLPKPVKRRIKALKKLQFKTIEIEAKFYEEVHELECKYTELYAPLFDRARSVQQEKQVHGIPESEYVSSPKDTDQAVIDLGMTLNFNIISIDIARSHRVGNHDCDRDILRREILNGNVEPTDSDCDWPSDEEEDEELVDDLQSKVKVEEIDETKEKQDKEEAEKSKEEENMTGIPEFWLTVFKNVEMLSEMVQEHDEPILKHLQDVKVNFQKSPPVGFTLQFQFSPNEYFTNLVLTKEYVMRCEPDENDPFSYEGPEIIRCKGCKIDWNKGKNVTIKVIKKAQAHRGNRGTKRILTKTIQRDSFFNFFNPPDVPEGETASEDTEAILGADFEIGHFLRERVVPRAVLYFTGEALEDDYDEEEGEEEDNDDDDEDGEYDEDADGDYDPKKDQQPPADCKQQ
ncbi:hypothetical protein LSH36_784g01040 [Paralvinella palmiformis]|uniref:Nucleosome assembly protein 1-like 4 n=1 Tax=Paralvinella palmiformis TaxID=53620 RepID=A0AAD9J055_9ANNE|nr:hypothetical protein LSH36_784g01040 [Paralvinella palmiformis]